MANAKLCSVAGCDKLRRRKEFCGAHYYHFLTKGDPLAGSTRSGEPLRWIKEHVSHDRQDCLLWPFGRSTNGYARITVGGVAQQATRIMCDMAKGPSPTPEHQAAHSCGKGHEGCMNPVHLVWKTRIENETDKLDHGTIKRGEDAYQAKLTKEQVLAIRSVSHAVAHRHLADQYGVSKATISDIARRRTWAWLE